ncbi:MAG: hypothetical protein FJ399_01905 [Verrucomicrobia bacterium]|nr:hypothetical protein [Verrucomicrobiota bacterium]
MKTRFAGSHSVLGTSNIPSDVLTQEYGGNFGLKAGILCGGCFIGQLHSGAELHGILSHLVKVVVQSTGCAIYGFNGK